MMAISTAGKAINDTCTTNCVIANCDQLVGIGIAKLPKNRNTMSSTPQTTAWTGDGKSSRSRIRCRSQRPTPNRSLSRNSTDSLLNC